jgi:hypothetical protein
MRIILMLIKWWGRGLMLVKLRRVRREKDGGFFGMNEGRMNGITVGTESTIE